MKVTAIISEYNPFHNGHKYHIETAKKETNSDYTVAIMSGATVQRGEFSIIHQQRRAETAVKNGIDLVLELPTAYSCQSAEIFAKGSINIINKLNIVDTVCCGTESSSPETLEKIAKTIIENPKPYRETIEEALNQGNSFPKARSLAIKNVLGIDLSQSPNDTLALEYQKALLLNKSKIKLHTIKRKGQGYNESYNTTYYPSATSIRQAFRDNSLTEEMMPKESLENLTKYGKQIDTFPILQTIILRDQNKLKEIFDIEEGIENKIIKNIAYTNSKEELIALCKSKRYTYTRLSRVLNNILLGITKEEIKIALDFSQKPYAKILAFNNKGREILKNIGEEITLINKPSKFTPENKLQEILWNMDQKTNQIYLIMSKEENKNPLTISPVYVR